MRFLLKVLAAWEPSEQLIQHLCGWVDGSYEDADLQYILEHPWPEKYRKASVVYRGEPLRKKEAYALSKDKHKAYGVSWTTDLKKTATFAEDHDAEFGVIFSYQPSPEEVVVNLDLLFKEFPKMVSKMTCSNAGEKEVILNTNVPLTRKNIISISPNPEGSDPDEAFTLPKPLEKFLKEPA